MSDLLTEVDEMMRQERMEKFWHDNKTFIIAFIVLTIVLTGVFSAYRAWDHSTKTEQTSELIAFMESADYPQNVLESEDLGFRAPLRAITWLGAAGTFMAQGDTENAYTLYARTADDKSVPDEYRYLAILMTTRIDSAKENADAKALLERLDPVLNADNPWKAEAQIEAAVIHANLQNDYKSAKDLLNIVLDSENLPGTLYDRAQKLHHIYALQTPESSSELNQTDQPPSQ